MIHGDVISVLRRCRAVDRSLDAPKSYVNSTPDERSDARTDAVIRRIKELVAIQPMKAVVERKYPDGAQRSVRAETSEAIMVVERSSSRDGLTIRTQAKEHPNKSHRRGAKLNNFSSRSLGEVPSYSSRRPDMRRVQPKVKRNGT